MKNLLLLSLLSIVFTSCQSDDVENGSTQIYGAEKPAQEIKHDQIPAKFRGQWTELDNNRIIVVVEAETLVMDLTDYGYGVVSLDSKTVNAMYSGGQGYHIGDFTISKGTVGVYTELLTVSVAGKKDCITRLKLYVPEVEQPQQPEEPETSIEEPEPPVVNIPIPA